MLCHNLSWLNRDYRVMPAKLSPPHSLLVVHALSAHTRSSQLATLWKKWPPRGSHLPRGTERRREGRDLSKWRFLDRNPVLYLQTHCFSAGQPALLQPCFTAFTRSLECGNLRICEGLGPFSMSQSPVLPWRHTTLRFRKHGLWSRADWGVNPDPDLFNGDRVQIL